MSFIPGRAEGDAVGPGDSEDLNDIRVHGHEVNRSAALRCHLEFLGLKDERGHNWRAYQNLKEKV